ncbi:hypothetical protein SAMN05444416_1177 [Thermoactinomyces sp. DSM 45892]|nr:hypothetical protein SAMN05444416_1177 [Thermoactinomyces sp. DSM 45892]
MNESIKLTLCLLICKENGLDWHLSEVDQQARLFIHER